MGMIAMTNGHNGDAGLRFRSVAANFGTGVTVVTSIADDVPVGTTVNAFASVSLDPAMVLVSLRNGSRLLSCMEDSGSFAVTVLAAAQQRLAGWFSSRTRPTGAASFAGIPARPAPVTGCLLLAEGIAYFDCRVSAVYPGGDHTIVLGEVAACGELWPREPLIFHGSGYVAVDRHRRDHPVDVSPRIEDAHYPVASAAVT
jgi:flavin reductase (DIM6/NTAB) family NADH-FMN oxidoreductase RutF